MNKLKKVLSENKLLYSIAITAGLLKKTRIFKVTGKRKKYPKVLQLPLTYNCNSKCVMCNVWHMDHSDEFTLSEFSKFMKDPLFSKVKAVGINGGEPTLVKELPLFVLEVLKLPKLKYLNIITHGFNKKLLLPALEKIYVQCKKYKVSFYVSISLDGYGAIHDLVRGFKVFDMTVASIKEIYNHQEKYCDSIDIACTVIKQNVDYLTELDVFATRNNYNIKYRMGIDNKRIESTKLIPQFSCFSDDSIQSAKEFFHSRIATANNIKDKFKYFAIHYSLTAKEKKRLLGCYWKDEGVTMDSRGDVYYCAVESDKIGGLRKQAGKDIFFAEKNVQYRTSIIKNKCNSCIHDYHGNLEISNVFFFLKQQIFEKYFWLFYFLKVKFT